MNTHEVRQIKIAFRISYEQRTALFKACNMLSGEIIVCQQASAVRIPFQSFPVKGAEQSIFIHLHTERLRKFLKQINPCIQVGGTVIAVNHGNGASVRGHYHVNLRMYLCQFFFKYYHGKYTGAR